VLAEAGVGIFRIEGVDEQREARAYRPAGKLVVEQGRLSHLRRAPEAALRLKRGAASRFHHSCTLHYKVLVVKIV